MQTFRASVDATNDITMLQDMNAMVQVTGWSKLDKLDASSGDVYFFDEEGRRTDTKKDPSNDQAVKARRLYQVKLLVEKAYQPGVPSSSPNSKAEMKDARRVVADFVETVATLPGVSESAHAIRLGIEPFAERKTRGLTQD